MDDIVKQVAGPVGAEPRADAAVGVPQLDRAELDRAALRTAAKITEGAARVSSLAADPDRPQHEMDQAIADLHRAVAYMAALSRRYCDLGL